MTEIEAPGRVVETEAAAPAGFGRRLAAERERLGLSVDEIAARLRLHPKQVRAIENEALPALPAPFLRGFVRNYAKEVRLDPAPLIAALNAQLVPQSGESQRLSAGGSMGARSASSDHGSRRIVVAGMLGVLVALAVVGGLATRSDKRRVETSVEATKPAAVVAAPPVGEQKIDPVLPPPMEATPPPPASPAPATSFAPAPALVLDSLRLSFREQSWAEVTQGDGRVVFSQTNEAGTDQRIDGKPPLRVVIGNAPAVSLDYKGKSIDLRAFTGADNVARLTLN